jgi:hypothetical protein
MPANQARKLLLLAAFSSAACVSTELTTSAGHPADPHASGGPVPTSSTLAPAFEPFQAYGIQGTAEAHEQHAHADHAQSVEPTPAGDAGHASHGQHAAADAGSSAAPDAGTVHVCPMHPEVRRAAPGRCPICGMKLVPRRKDGAR